MTAPDITVCPRRSGVAYHRTVIESGPEGSGNLGRTPKVPPAPGR